MPADVCNAIASHTRSAVRVPLGASDKIPEQRRHRPLQSDFRVGGNQPKVVQEGRAKGNFLVDNRAADASYGKVSKNISPNTVIADELWRSRFQQIYCRFGQRCIGDANAS